MTSPCARCPAVLGRSCCEVGPGESLATLTRADVERIRDATGRAPATFVESEWLSWEDALDYERRRPLYAGYFRQGPERLTLRQARGACVFHRKGEGCTLPEEARPRACRLYPFEPWPDGSVTLLVGRHGGEGEGRAAHARGEPACLAVEAGASLEGLMAAFGVSPETLSAWAQGLRADAIAHGRPAARRRP